MKHKIFTIYDDVLETYSTPILAINKGHMIRMLVEWSKNPQNQLTQNTKEKTLFELGDYEDQTGRMDLYPANKNVGMLHEELRQPEQEMN